MPSLEKHMEISRKRTGKTYREVHEWMNQPGFRFISAPNRNNVGMLRSNPLIRKSKQEALDRYKRELLEQKHRQGYEKHPVSADEFPVWKEEQLFTKVKKKEAFCTQALSINKTQSRNHSKGSSTGPRPASPP